MQWILARLKEPSTYAGLGVSLAGMLHLSPAASGSLESAIMAVGGALAVILAEKSA